MIGTVKILARRPRIIPSLHNSRMDFNKEEVDIMKRYMKLTALFAVVAIIVSFAISSVGLAGSSLTGEKVYNQNCSHCHAERQATERTDLQWKIIAAHMRVRANLTAEEAQKVLEYLQSAN